MVDAFEFVVPLRVVAPRGAVPADWASDFRSLLGRRGALAFEARAQVADIVTELSSPEKGWEEEGGMAKKKRKALKNRRHRSAATADAVCLSDQWLGPAVSRGLLQPIPGAEEQRWWVSLFGGERIERDGWGMERREERRGAQWNERLTHTHLKKKKKKKKKKRDLSPRWRSLCFRDASTGRRVPLDDPRGAVFAAPFRWGCTLVAFRGGRLRESGDGGREMSGSSGGGEQALTDWSDLLRPDLRGRVAFSDSPRDLLTAALGCLGLPPSPPPGTEIDPGALRGAVLALRRQALTFDGRDHVRALAAGDALAAVGSSADLLPLALRSGAVSLMAPASGTALWADLWCVPAFAGSSLEGGKAGGGGETSAPPASSGPSPLLPAWFELALTDSRAEPGRGLRGGGGASPLLLPPTLEEMLLAEEEKEEAERKKRRWWWQVWRKKEEEQPRSSSSRARSSSSGRPSSSLPPVSSDRAERSRAALVVGGALPSREVLSRSDFCVPAADERLERAFREALRP